VTYEFRWNDDNVGHIAKHGVEIDEAEYIVEHPDSGFPRVEAGSKYLVWGDCRRSVSAGGLHFLTRERGLRDPRPELG
jgi:hypothetical protein